MKCQKNILLIILLIITIIFIISVSSFGWKNTWDLIKSQGFTTFLSIIGTIFGINGILESRKTGRILDNIEQVTQDTRKGTESTEQVLKDIQKVEKSLEETVSKIDKATDNIEEATRLLLKDFPEIFSKAKEMVDKSEKKLFILNYTPSFGRIHCFNQKYFPKNNDKSEENESYKELLKALLHKLASLIYATKPIFAKSVSFNFMLVFYLLASCIITFKSLK